MGKVGLLFPPPSHTDLESHAARLSLMADLLADCDPDELDAAVMIWAQTSKWLPTVAELLDIIAGGDGSCGTADSRQRGGVHYVSDSGYSYRGSQESVMREAEKRSDWSTYYQARVDMEKTKAIH